LQLRPGKQYRENSDASAETATPQPLRLTVYVQWLLLSALPSVFLLATTNYITLEIGSFPFIWVIPLALYLGSFIVTFRTGGGVPQFLRVFWLELLLAAFSLYLLESSHWLVLVGLSGIFFAICLVAHGTLYELRPAVSRLTNFYLASALGGWIGGAFVSLVAPFAFPGLFEYPIVLILFAALFWWHRDKAFLTFWPKASRFAAWGRMLALGIIIVPIVLSIRASATEPTKFRHRNFYGTYHIVDKTLENGSVTVRELVHGRTLHGAQFLDPSVRLTPISYYHQGGPIFEAYELIPSPRKIAVVGLGSGTITAYARKNDLLTYYEIDPDNEKIARTWFTYLNECKGKVSVTVGDGRLSMQDWNTDKTKYDLITIDAFTGDGIPTHLLTKEAISIYLGRLRENGVILFHISNRFYDLRPVLKATAGTLCLAGAMNVRIKNKEKATPVGMPGQCVTLAVNPKRLQPLLDRGWIPFGKEDGLRGMEPWSDDHINILAPLASGVTLR
jgi:spermidine synthase